MVDEMTALNTYDTLKLVPLPLGKSPIDCQWIYTVKMGFDGKVDHLKGHLVVKGYRQIYGQDYNGTFSLRVKVSSIQLFLSIATMCN